MKKKEEYLELLKSENDLENIEVPGGYPDFPYKQKLKKYKDIFNELKEKFNITDETHGLQDIMQIGEIYVVPGSDKEDYLRITFSNFGNFFTISDKNEEVPSIDLVNGLIKELNIFIEKRGYTYIPVEILNERDPDLEEQMGFETWYDRYFGWS